MDAARFDDHFGTRATGSEGQLADPLQPSANDCKWPTAVCREGLQSNDSVEKVDPPKLSDH